LKNGDQRPAPKTRPHGPKWQKLPVLSSQVDLQGSQAKQGYVSLSANCEVGQGALQRLLYDLESGMPFLFIDQLVVQMPQSGGGAGVETEAARKLV
jgi:Type II secretion system (T2SS), protein M subtype b